MSEKKNRNLSDRAFRVMFGKKGLDLNSKEEKDTSKEIVKWGNKNDLPQSLVDLYYGSALHQGIINGKVSYATGGGFEIIEGDETAIKAFLNNGTHDFTIDENASQSALDKYLLGMMVIKLVFSNDKKYSYCETIDTDICRLSSCGKFIRVSEDWTDSKCHITSYPIYDVNLLEEGELSQVIVVKRPSKRLKKEKGIYPKPDYQAGLKDIEADKEISNYGLSEILNGFTGGTIINDPSGVPETQEEKDEAKKKADKFTGPDNAASVIINYSDGVEEGIQVIHLNGNQLQDRYEMVDKRVKNNILMAHSIPSGMLVGIKTEGQLGGSTELENAFNIWNNTQIRHDQKFINDVYNWIMNEVAGIPGKIALKKASLYAVDAEDTSVLTILSSISPMIASEILKRMNDQEVRDMADLKPLVQTPMHKCNHDTFELTDDEKVIYSSYGVSMKGKSVYFSRDIETGLDSFSVGKLEPTFMNDFFEDIGTLTAKEKVLAVLDLLGKGERLGDIPTLINSTTGTVSKYVQTLKDLDMLDDQLNITDKGNKYLEASTVPTDQFEVRYLYEKRDDVTGESVMPTTREFCRDLIALNRAFTREEIDQISAQVGYDVFFRRGGWYHNPQTGRNTPFCRHTWKFILMRK